MDDSKLDWYENSVKVHNIDWRQADSTIAWLAENAPALKEATEVLDKKLRSRTEDASIET